VAKDSVFTVTVYTKSFCPYCVMAKRLLSQRGIEYQEILVRDDDDAEWDRLYKLSGMKTMPQIFHKDKLIGGYNELAELDEKTQLVQLKS
jgi:glutaredoxin 3